MMFSNRLLVFGLSTFFAVSLFADQTTAPGQIKKNGVDMDLRSNGRTIADEVAVHGNAVINDGITVVPGTTLPEHIRLRGDNVQTNDGSLDNIQIFPGTRPFVKFTQSETTVAAFEKNIVVSYNTSANQPIVQVGPSLLFTHRFFSGFSTSNDGGQTWTSGFMPPVPGSIFTFGDGVVTVDRDGNFYFSGLGTDALNRGTVQVNKSMDGGRTWSNAVVVQQDNGSDKEWIAVGPDPVVDRTNVYVTWTSFQSTGAQLRFGRSIDGGATWTTKTIFAPSPNPDPAMPQNSLQFTQPFVDPTTGRLYIAFLQVSNVDQDFIRILASDDAGQTFSFLNFNVVGSPIASGLPVVSAGELIDCGLSSGGARLAIHSGPNVGGVFGLRNFVQASRLVTQPAFAARGKRLVLAWSNSTSPIFGDSNGKSNVMFVRSADSGATWSAPIQVNPAVATNIHHVLPSLSLRNPVSVHIAYYTQHSDGTVDVDMANSHDGGETFPADRTARVTSVPSALAPVNITLSLFVHTNYDRTVRACYNLGEYLGVTAANGEVYAAWGDGRNSVTEPVNALDPLSGQTHPQQDVFFQRVKAQ